MNKKQRIISGFVCLGFVPITMIVLCLIVIICGVEAMGGFVLPITFTVYFVLHYLSGYFFIRSGIIPKHPRRIMYFLGAYSALGMLVWWIDLLF